jgi:hypothetical protein
MKASRMKKKMGLLCLVCVVTQVQAQNPQVLTESNEALGLYAASQFQLGQGAKVVDKRIPAPALWYFKQQTIATPKPDMPVAGYSSTVNGTEDIPADLDTNALPSLVWIGSNYVLNHVQISANGQNLTPIEDQKVGTPIPLSLVPKIPTNLSYWNADTLRFFQQRPVRMRGELTENGFVARTVWPEDFRLHLEAKPQPLNRQESLKSLVQAEDGGAKSAYQSRLLWERAPGVAKQSAGKAALGFMLNGAQGDDDEAHGGHFAVATGKVETDGGYASWLVNNYYDLASNSEKGIIAGITPMDNYMADLNSGQSYYRPSYMLVAVFKSDRLPLQFQAATNRVYQHFYRNDFLYDHSRNNCAGVSIDTLRALGWQVPNRGVESQLKGTAAYFYVSATEKSLTKGRAIYDYLNTETTRLFPAVAFDAIGENMLLGATQWSRRLYIDHNPVTPFMQQFGQEVEAIYFVRIPQIPSSRAFGLAPVYSFDHFMQQAPADRSQWKVVPTTPNPLPESLKDGLALQAQSPNLFPWPVVLVLVLLMGGLKTLWAKVFRGRFAVKST